MSEHIRNVHVEDAVIALLLRDPEAMLRYEMDAEMFTQPAALSVYERIRACIEQGIVPDRAMLATDLKMQEEYVEKVSSIVLQNPAETYVEKAREYMLRRRLLRASEELARAATSLQEMDPDDLAGFAQTVADSVSKGAAKARRAISRHELACVLFDALSTTQPREVAYTGIHAIDAILEGIEPKTLVVIAATPSTGKTVLMEQIANNLAKTGEICGVMSIETAADRLARRAIAAQTGISTVKMKSGELSEDNFAVLADIANIQHYGRIWYDDRSDVTDANFAMRVRALVSQTGAKNVFVDYLQLIGGQMSDNRRLQIDSVVNAAKELAKELGLRVFLISQLSRQASEYDDTKKRRPRMYHLKESSGIEQAADVIILLERDTSIGERETRFYIDKNRDGRVGSGLLWFDPVRMIFNSNDYTD